MAKAADIKREKLSVLRLCDAIPPCDSILSLPVCPSSDKDKHPLSAMPTCLPLPPASPPYATPQTWCRRPMHAHTVLQARRGAERGREGERGLTERECIVGAQARTAHTPLLPIGCSIIKELTSATVFKATHPSRVRARPNAREERERWRACGSGPQHRRSEAHRRT